jgi:hypothetical protein
MILVLVLVLGTRGEAELGRFGHYAQIVEEEHNAFLPGNSQRAFHDQRAAWLGQLERGTVYMP